MPKGFSLQGKVTRAEHWLLLGFTLCNPTYKPTYTERFVSLPGYWSTVAMGCGIIWRTNAEVEENDRYLCDRIKS